MIRIEIYANRSVEENLLEAFKIRSVAKYYTKFQGVLGVGTSGPRMGDAVWPEENVAFVIWCEEEDAAHIRDAVADVKKHFPGEGVKLFTLGGGETIPKIEALTGPLTQAALPPPPPPPEPIIVQTQKFSGEEL
jgi:hypothetical protein